ncbi:MFS transporter [Rhizobium sp.]|uniref:MFS transporter n=1 Tax=Rhizobium sp. TaxID=391 RepID=UPI002AA93BEC
MSIIGGASQNSASYVKLMRLQGAAAQVFLGAVARFPVSSSGVAIVMSASHSLGNYTSAGIAAAIYSFVTALAMPAWAKWMDVRGQFFVLSRVAIFQAFSLCLLAALCARGADDFIIWVSAALVGASSIDVGSVVRARWKARLDTRSDHNTAFMLESVVDEAMFALAPAMTMVAASFNPYFAPVIIIVGPLIGLLGLSRIGSFVHMREGDHGRQGWLPTFSSWLLITFLAFLFIGALFGVIEVLLIAYSVGLQIPAFSGIALAAWATGSGAIALLFGPRLSSLDPRLLIVGGVSVMISFTFLMSMMNTPSLLVLWCFLAGLGAAPAISGGFSYVSHRCDKDRATQTMALLTTALSFGTVIGASLGGLVADNFPIGTGFMTASFLGLAAMIFASLTFRTGRL